MVGLSWLTNITQSLPLVVSDKPVHRNPTSTSLDPVLLKQTRACEARTLQVEFSTHMWYVRVCQRHLKAIIGKEVAHVFIESVLEEAS